ncbi:MAG: hypothetical protein LBJ95_01930 [Oscillospiraceae bacterium]|jgi:hypothetical protein|nr:hypothetical protein [Oscillospiraceae bacterium]
MKKLASFIAAGTMLSAIALTNSPSANALNIHIFPGSRAYDGIVSVSGPNGSPELFGINRNQLRYSYSINKEMTTFCSIDVEPKLGNDITILLTCRESSGVYLTAEITPISWRDNISHGPTNTKQIINTKGYLKMKSEVSWTYDGANIEVKNNDADCTELHLELYW